MPPPHNDVIVWEKRGFFLPWSGDKGGGGGGWEKTVKSTFKLLRTPGIAAFLRENHHAKRNSIVSSL
jgi:hypothetical protein